MNILEKKRKNKSLLWKLIFYIKDGLWFIFYKVSHILYDIKLYFHKDNKVIFKENPKYKISFCIPCMNRLEHIQKTLIKNISNNLEYPYLEFVLLDYNSEDGLEKWVKNNCSSYLEKGTLKYFKTKKSKYFNMSKAKNYAHKIATGDILCNLDADNYLGYNFAFFINEICCNKQNILGRYDHNQKNNIKPLFDVGGRIFLFKKDFVRLGGYDESMVGWGWEDVDLFNRAINLGLEHVFIPEQYLRSVSHSNRLRIENSKHFDPYRNYTKMLENIDKKIIKVNTSKIPEDLRKII